MKPVIGIIPLYDEGRDSIWMLPGYMEGILIAGGVPVILPLCDTEDELYTAYELCDGFLFTGGQDINPARYDEYKLEVCGVCNEVRDELEHTIFRRAYEEDKPILGICRGIQMINVELGGSLYQDLASQRQFTGEVRVEHKMKPSHNRFIHNVEIVEHSALRELLQTDTIGVNSYHHQGIKSLGNDLEIMAYAPDGLIEAVRCKKKGFIWGIQWHPELLHKTDTNSMRIFKAFIEAVLQ